MAPQHAKYKIPHFLGRVDYSGKHRFDPDGDTIHLRDPVLLVDGQATKPQDGNFLIWVTGKEKPVVIRTKGGSKPYLPIRLEGIDAPEEHYRAMPFSIELPTGKVSYPLDPSKPHDERSQPLWKPATDYLLNVLQKSVWVLVMLDREVKDRYNRVLGYVYTSDEKGKRGAFVSLQLVARGLAFPFLFESAGDLIPIFLRAARKAKKAKKGVWRNFVDPPLSYVDSFPCPSRYTSPEPDEQANHNLNLPVVFRRIVDSEQLKGLSLPDALRKYDAIDFETGELVPGDRYETIPIENRIWAPHTYK